MQRLACSPPDRSEEMTAPTSEWVELRGIVVEGYGVASGAAKDSPYPRGSIEMQSPYFRSLGLDLTGFYLGTLNVSVEPHSVSLDKPRYTFRSVHWSPNHEPEDFSFSPCQVAYGPRWHSGFVYHPHEETKSRHHHAASTLEIITDHLAGISYGDRIDLLIRADEFTIQSER